jgi:hypothetical protein
MIDVIDPLELPDLGVVGNFKRSLDAVLPQHPVAAPPADRQASRTDKNHHSVAYMLNSYSDVWPELLPHIKDDPVLHDRVMNALELRAQFNGDSDPRKTAEEQMRPTESQLEFIADMESAGIAEGLDSAIAVLEE